MIRTFLAVSAVAFAPIALAQQSIDPASTNPAAASLCPEVGTPAPDFSAVTRDGISVNLADISGSGGAIVVFSRSLDWCPYCKKQALDLKTISDQLEADGWPLSLVTYDSVETLDDYASDNSINYTLLSDTDSAMFDAFGLRNMDVTKGSRFDGIPHPAIVYIGADDKVVGIQKEEGYKDRPPTEGIPQLVALLNQGVPTETTQ